MRSVPAVVVACLLATALAVPAVVAVPVSSADRPADQPSIGVLADRAGNGSGLSTGERAAATVATHAASVSGSYEAAIVRSDLAAAPSERARARRLAAYQRTFHERLLALASEWRTVSERYRAGEIDRATFGYRTAALGARARSLAALSATASAATSSLPADARADAGLATEGFDAIARHGRGIAGNATGQVGELRPTRSAGEPFVLGGPTDALANGSTGVDGVGPVDGGDDALGDGTVTGEEYTYAEFRRAYGDIANDSSDGDGVLDDTLTDADPTDDGLVDGITGDGATATASDSTPTDEGATGATPTDGLVDDPIDAAPGPENLTDDTSENLSDGTSETLSDGI